MTKVPHGTRDEANTTSPRSSDQRATIMTCKSAAQKPTNSPPWIDPARRTAIDKQVALIVQDAEREIAQHEDFFAVRAAAEAIRYG